MVVGHGIFNCVYHWTVRSDISSVIQSKRSKTLSSLKQLDKIGNAYRYFINGIFLFLFMNKIILASQSPRRKQLLEWAEIPFEILVKETSEDYPPGLEPEEVAVYIAQQKAAAVQKLVSTDRVIVAADTIVVLGESI